ncbi:MAG: hypothetical protein COC05_05470 [Gammaproteobacteria bacterium]|nr:MAG: hypothetical protein COC05_05470 [Gammaproteobacteria bacterium]
MTRLSPVSRLIIAFALIAIAVAWVPLSAQYHRLYDTVYRLTWLERDLEHLNAHYGVRITTDLTPDDYRPEWLDDDTGQLATGSKIVLTSNADDFARFVRLITPEIKRYAPALIRQHLTRVYCLDKLTLYDAPFGGTYNIAQSSLYLLNKNDFSLSSWMKETFHHELSSMLMKKQGFDEGAWRQAAGLAFRYQQDENPWFQWMYLRGYVDPVADTTVFFKRGLLRHYSETGVENDFNSYAQFVFMRPDTMQSLIAQYPPIARKYQVFKDFYLGIDPGLAPVFAAIDG